MPSLGAWFNICRAVKMFAEFQFGQQPEQIAFRKEFYARAKKEILDPAPKPKPKPKPISYWLTWLLAAGGVVLFLWALTAHA